MDTLVNGRIRGHSQLQGKHKAFEEVFGQLWDLLGEDLADEGDELVILVAQRGELGVDGGGGGDTREQRVSPQKEDTKGNGEDAATRQDGFHLEQVLRHEREHDVDAVEDHVCRRHRPTGGRRPLVLVPEHLVCTHEIHETHVVKSGVSVTVFPQN